MYRMAKCESSKLYAGATAQSSIRVTGPNVQDYRFLRTFCDANRVFGLRSTSAVAISSFQFQLGRRTAIGRPDFSSLLSSEYNQLSI